MAIEKWVVPCLQAKLQEKMNKIMIENNLSFL